MLYEIKHYYYCPFCESAHGSEAGAKWCREDCAKKESIYHTKEIVCSGCDRRFETEREFYDHLMNCSSETCATCEHCDLEMRRSGPCREFNGSKIIEACDYFERAFK